MKQHYEEMENEIIEFEINDIMVKSTCNPDNSVCESEGQIINPF